MGGLLCSVCDSLRADAGVGLGICGVCCLDVWFCISRAKACWPSVIFVSCGFCVCVLLLVGWGVCVGVCAFCCVVCDGVLLRIDSVMSC